MKQICLFIIFASLFISCANISDKSVLAVIALVALTLLIWGTMAMFIGKEYEKMRRLK